MSDIEKQLTILKKQILGMPKSTGKGFFYVFPIEAGLGKTETLIHAMVEQYQSNPAIKSLIVTKLRNEGQRIADRINLDTGNNTALFLDETPENKYLKTKAKDYSVLIITHAKYLALNTGSPNMTTERIITFTSKRTNLIIDEDLNYIDIIEFNKNIINEILNTVGKTNDSKTTKRLHKITSNWERLLNANYINTQATVEYFSNPKVEEDVCELLDSIQKLHFSHGHFSGNRKIKSKSDLMDAIWIITKLFNRNIVLVGERIYFDNTTANQFSLDNNIILDATADMNSRYYLSSQYHVVRLKKIVDHNHWTLNWYNDNTSANAKRNNPDYEDNIVKFIKANFKGADKALVITNKSEAEYFEQIFSHRRNIKFANFEKMKGVNTWRNFNKCFIIHTHTLPLPHYPITYMAITGKTLTAQEMKLIRTKGSVGFINHQPTQTLMEDDIASSIYQAIKRINRNNKQNAEIFLLCNREKVVNKVVAQLNNIQVVQHAPTLKKRTYDITNRQSEFGKRFIDILRDGLKKARSTGKDVEYRKKDLRTQINCSVGNFSKLVLKQPTVIEFMNKHGIESIGQKIVICHK